MAGKGDILDTAIKFVAKKVTVPQCKLVCLDIGLNKVDFDTIINNNPNDVGTQKYLMLDKWKDKFGKEATLQALEKALEENECAKIPVDLRQHLIQKGFQIASGDSIQTPHRQEDIQGGGQTSYQKMVTSRARDDGSATGSKARDEMDSPQSASADISSQTAVVGNVLPKSNQEYNISQSSSSQPQNTPASGENDAKHQPDTQPLEQEGRTPGTATTQPLEDRPTGEPSVPKATALPTDSTPTVPQTESSAGESFAHPFQETPAMATDPLGQLKDFKLGHRLKVFTREKIDAIANEFVECIQKGSFGDVYKGKMEHGGKFNNKVFEVAIKHVKLNILPDQVVADFKRRSVANVRHPYIVPIIGTFDEPRGPLHMVYSYMKRGDLEQALKRLSVENDKSCPDGKLDSKKCITIIAQISAALTYLHNQSPPIIHLDVTPANILLDEFFNARLGDVGFCHDNKTVDSDPMKFPAVFSPGTPGYQDPSLLEDWSYQPTNDVFSLGVVMLRMLTDMPAINRQKPPQSLHAHLRKQDCFKDIQKLLQKVTRRVWLSDDKKTIAEGFAELACKCIKLASEERISMEELHEQMKNLMGVGRLFRKPVDEIFGELCVFCHSNPVVHDLHLISKQCTDTCDVACVQCLIDSKTNPLICPEHGPAQPPIGHCLSFGLFIGASSEKDDFHLDAQGLYEVFTDPKIGAIRKENAFLMTSESEENLQPTADNILKQLKNIKDKMAPCEEESSLIFYFSGHGSEKGSRLLCSAGNTLESSQLRSEIHGMNFTQLLLILDCCYAAKNGPMQVVLGDGKESVIKKAMGSDGDDDDEKLLEDSGIPVLYTKEVADVIEKSPPTQLSSKYSVIQWSSSMHDERSVGYRDEPSNFTSHIIAGLRAAKICKLRSRSESKTCERCPRYRQKMQSQSCISFCELNEYVFHHVEEQLRCTSYSQTPNMMAQETIRVNRKIAYCC